jgi:hypothetical protein
MKRRLLVVLLRSTVFFAAGSGSLAIAEDAGISLSLTAPSEWQVVQRRTATEGDILIEGTWSKPKATLAPDRLEARVLSRRNGQTTEESPWHALPFDPRVWGFRGTLPAPAGGWHEVELRLMRGADLVARSSVAHVGVGEVFIIAGQSNSANYGEERQQTSSGQVTAWDGQRWVVAHDPQPVAGGTKGSFVPAFGDALARRLGVPIGVISVGLGSTSVREWQPRGTPMKTPPTTGRNTVAAQGGVLVSNGFLFERLESSLRAIGTNGVRAILWHQGESDWNQPSDRAISTEDYRTNLSNLIAASRASANRSVPWFVAQASYHSPSDPGSPEFRAAQLAVVDNVFTYAGPNTDLLGTEWREGGGKGVHFSSAGLERHGTQWAEIVGSWIEQQYGLMVSPRERVAR